jgi:hypothetical protein
MGEAWSWVGSRPRRRAFFSSPALRGRGGARREAVGGEGLYRRIRKTLTSQAFGLGPSSPVRTGEGLGGAVRRTALAVASLSAAASAQAAPTLHPLFSDHAVLQRGRPIAIWGTAEPGERVKVSLGSASRDVTAGRDGRWRAELPAMDAGGPYRLEAAGARQWKFHVGLA